MRNIVGRLSDWKKMLGRRMPKSDGWMDKYALENSDILSLGHPIQHGNILDWNDYSRILHQSFYNFLRAAPEEHPVIITDSPLKNYQTRAKIAEVVFEDYQPPLLFIASSSPLALLSTGRTTGLVLECGATTFSVPIYEGHALPLGTLRTHLGGGTLTQYLMQRLNEKGKHNLHTSKDRESIRELKEKICFVANDSQENFPAVAYVLPDGRTVSVGEERYRSAEILLRPSIISAECPGLLQLLLESISRTDAELEKELCSNVMLCGGSTLFPGILPRLNNELVNLAPNTNIHITVPENRQNSVWIGGAMFSSLSTIERTFVSAEEYKEHGARIVTAKCF